MADPDRLWGHDIGFNPVGVPAWARAILPRSWMQVDGKQRHDLDWGGIRLEWRAACVQLVEDAIESMGDAKYAARSRAGNYRDKDEVGLAWCAAAAREALAQLSWTYEVWEQEKKQAEALMRLVAKHWEASRG